MSVNPLVSVVIPARNEARNLGPLLAEILAALAKSSFEVIVVDDGSDDDTGAMIAATRAAGLPVRHLRHDRPLGQSASVRTGLLAAGGEIVVTLDGDGQNDPAFIPRLIEMLEGGGANLGLVSGRRRRRTDAGIKRYASRFANGLRQWVLKDGADDSACGLKAIRREVFLLLPFFDGQHRFMPALVKREGYEVAWLDIVDRRRRFGRSNYGIVDRGLRGLLDLFGVWWLKRRFRGRADANERR
ncbi:MAG: glycosyltransferase family 2 protein [Bauldia sp.]